MRECDWIYEIIKKTLKEDLDKTLNKLQCFFAGLSDRYSTKREHITLCDTNEIQKELINDQWRIFSNNAENFIN